MQASLNLFRLGKLKLYKTLREKRVLCNARKPEAARTRMHKPTKQEMEAFTMLQKLFTHPQTLTHADPLRPPARLLYVDVDAS